MIKTVDYLLLGGGLASASAAETLRREGITGKIVIVSAENILPYHRPQLPKAFLLGKRDKEKLLIFDERFYKKNNIEVMLSTKALAVAAEDKIVKTDRAGDIHFKQLLIATGCSPKKMNVPGSNLAGIYYLKTIADVEAILPEMARAKKAIILGGGFLGIELASSLVKKNIHVSIITDEFIFFHIKPPTVDITTYLENHGVAVFLNETIKKFNGEQRVQSIETTIGNTLVCDFVIIAAGSLPETDFLRDSGINVDDGVVVNQYMQTNKPGIYAAGDVTYYFDPVFGRSHRTGGWDNAINQGKIAASNMMGDKRCNRSAPYFFFNAFDDSCVIVGDATDANEKIIRGSTEAKNVAFLYLKDSVLRAALFLGRPITEIKAAESLIVNQVNLDKYKNQLPDIAFPLEEIATQTILTLQGGGALGAFECGVVKAMEEYEIYPDIVAGISIGAFNSAIIAANPKNATAALEAFWDELSLDTPDAPSEQMRRALSSWQSIVAGSPKFFYPKWLMPMNDPSRFPTNWTSFYDPTVVKKLLCKYIDFAKLKDSPIRLLIMAVNVETSEFEAFDSYTDEMTPDHILASGSLPPGFPWTTINGKHYWDGGIVTNTPLDLTLEICGTTSKKVYIVELYPRKRPLPKNMIEVLTRKDEILFTEKIKKDMRTRDLINNYKKLIEGILKFCDPAVIEEIKEIPTFIQTMGDPGVLSITRIVRKLAKDEPYSWDTDFSRKTILEHKEKGYVTAKKELRRQRIHRKNKANT